MTRSWKGLTAGAAAVLGTVVLGAVALTGGAVNAQSPSPTPSATTAPTTAPRSAAQTSPSPTASPRSAAQPTASASPAASPAASPSGGTPGTPPMRVYGTAQVSGQAAPSGTSVSAQIGSATCGTAQVSGTGTYVLDVNSAASQSGCGTDGATVNFTVGSARATQTATWRQGAFTEVNLSSQAATATATAAPTSTATRPPTSTPSPRPTTQPTSTRPPSTPSATPRPPASPTPQAQRPAKPAAQKPAAPAAPAAQRPAAVGGGVPAALPRTGTGGMQADTSANAGWVLGGLALAVVALGATGLAAYRRTR